MIETKESVKMKNVLFYGDSNTWGYQGDNPMHRLDADKRKTSAGTFLPGFCQVTKPGVFCRILSTAC